MSKTIENERRGIARRLRDKNKLVKERNMSYIAADNKWDIPKSMFRDFVYCDHLKRRSKHSRPRSLTDALEQVILNVLHS